MKTPPYRINRSDLPILADHILSTYKHDLSTLGENALKFNAQSLSDLEQKINLFSDRLKMVSNKILTAQEKEVIEKLLGDFKPLLKHTAHFIGKNSTLKKQAELNPLLADLELAFNKKNIRDIQHQSVILVRQFEKSVDQLIDLGFVKLLVREFKILIKRLNDLESDLTEQHLMSNDAKFKEEDNELIRFLETIIKSTPMIFSHRDPEKTQAYAIEKWLLLNQLNKSEIH